MNFTVLKIKDFETNIKLSGAKFYCGLGMAIIALVLLMMHDASLKADVVFLFAFLVLGAVEVRCDKKTALLLNVLWMVGVSLWLFYLPQYLVYAGIDQIQKKNLALGVLFVGTILVFWYICFRNSRIAVIVSTVLLMGLTVVNYYVERFRGEELTPADFLVIGTAADVASQYDYSVNERFIYFLCLAALACFCGFCVPKLKKKWEKKTTIILMVAELLLVIVVVSGIRGIVPQHYFRTTGTIKQGFYINFLSKLNERGMEQPEGYNPAFVEEISENYTKVSDLAETAKKPDIIVIMGEAFGDLRVLGEVKTNSEVLPFYDSLQENTIKGKALVSGFGGGTCNSEFEMLTGFSMGNLPSKTFPYQQYIKENTWSMAHYLRSQGYKTMATHPANELNWKRKVVYPLLGFEDTHFIEDYSGEDLVRGHVSDMEMVEQLISWYENEKAESPLFYFGVTMQNHSPYDKEDFDATVKLEGYSKEYPTVEQYLTLVQMTDRAIQKLVEYFETVQNDVVVVVYGDHMAQVPDVCEEQKDTSTDALRDKLNQHTVPFFVWSNYDIEEKNVEYTSLNYLSNYIYETAGLEMPAFNQFLKKVQEKIPAINTFGYYSSEKGMFDELGNMSEEEKELLNQYTMLQYNGMFDYKNANEIFFPLQEGF